SYYFSTFAQAINNVGEIVGWSTQGRNHALFWDSRRVMHRLENLIPPLSGVGLEIAYDINDHGQIAVRGASLNPPGPGRAYLATPVRPTLTLAVSDDEVVAGAVNELVVTGASPGARVVFGYS